jgi:hypothetical protein
MLRKLGIKLEVHHINGDPTDHRLENLGVLCEDCHPRGAGTY